MRCPGSVFFVLCILLICQSSHLHDLSESSPSSSGGHHHHHHHHNTQQQGGGPAASEDAISAPESDQKVAKLQKSGEGDRESGEEVRHQEMSEAEGGRTPTSAVPKTTQSAASVDGLSADQRPDRQLNGQKSHHPQEHLNVSPQPTDPRAQEKDHPEKHPSHPELSRKEVPDPKTTFDMDDTKSSNDSDVTEDGKLQSVPAIQDLHADSERNVSVLPAHAQEVDNDDVKHENPSQNKGFLEIPAKSSDEKLVNRPRWRHTLRHSEEDDNGEDTPKTYNKQVSEDDIPDNRPQNSEDLDPDPDSDPKSDPEIDPKAGPIAKGSRSHNRPRWYASSKPEKDADVSSRKNPVRPTERANTDVHTKGELEENSDVSNQKMIRKKKKQKDRLPAGSAKEVKQKRKWKSKHKNKRCHGCKQTEAKLAEARELHKQVLKAQLLDKLRLVPTFKKQPWPPKLPEQVFPDLSQRDQAGYEDQYYAKPTQLLLFGRDLGPRHRLKKAGTGSYQFGVTGKVKGKVRSARLWVYKMRDANDVHEQTLVITELQKSKKRRLRERSLVARLDTHVQEGWVSFDVTHLVRRWIESGTPASLQLLAIRCKTCHRTNYRAIFGIKSHFRPVLVIRESRERHRHREKRSTCDPTNGCCKFDMTVSFEELGIHEIFRPLTIQADYCFGTCERPDVFHYNHTMIMQYMRFNSHFHNSTMRHRLKPCCVPVVLREATIFHYLNAGLDTQVSLVPNLLVERCGCA